MQKGQFMECHITFHFLFSMNKTCYCQLFSCPLSLILGKNYKVVKELQFKVLVTCVMISNNFESN